jgi:hypothetical protein
MFYIEKESFDKVVHMYKARIEQESVEFLNELEAFKTLNHQKMV